MSLEILGKMANDFNICRCCVGIPLPIRMENWSFGVFSLLKLFLVSILPRKTFDNTTWTGHFHSKTRIKKNVLGGFSNNLVLLANLFLTTHFHMEIEVWFAWIESTHTLNQKLFFPIINRLVLWFWVACPETKSGTVISFSENTQNVSKSHQSETK